MKYTGRIMSLLIVAINTFGFMIYIYFSYDHWDLIPLFILAIFLGIGWKLGKQYDQVKYRSEQDALTGSYNRRFVMDLFPKLKRMSDLKAQKLVIFLIDVDDFKSINDQYGHAKGDRVLQLLASTLKKACGDSDYTVRWGGDEFVCVFPCTEALGMNELHMRLLSELNRLSIKVSIDISVSVGYATYPVDGAELNELIRVADRSMYKDKHYKKNNQKIGTLVSNGN